MLKLSDSDFRGFCRRLQKGRVYLLHRSVRIKASGMEAASQTLAEFVGVLKGSRV